MRSALRRDLEIGVFNPADSEDVRVERGQGPRQENASVHALDGERPAMRPHIVSSTVKMTAPEPAVPALALPEPVAPQASVPEVGMDDGHDDAPNKADVMSALLSDLQAIMASLDAKRKADRTEEPGAEPETDQSEDEFVAQASDTDQAPRGLVTSAALRAFHGSEPREEPVVEPGFGARLIAEEAARIAAERREQAIEEDAHAVKAEPSRALTELPVVDFAQSSAYEDNTPYVYGAHDEAAERAEFAELFAPARHSERADDVASVPARAEPVRADTGADDVLAREYAQPKYRGPSAAPVKLADDSSAFDFDVHAFMGELEREATQAHQQMAVEPDVTASGDHQATAADTEVSVSVVPPAMWSAAEPAPAIGTVAAMGDVAAPRQRMAVTEAITWKRFALLGAFVVLAGGAAISLQGVAARNDAADDKPAANAAVAAVAPAEPDADAGASEATPPVAGENAAVMASATPRDVTPKAEADTPPAQDVPAAAAVNAPRPITEAPVELRGAAPSDANALGLSGPAPGAEVASASDAVPDAAPTPESPAAEAPVAEVPVPQPAPPKVAAAAPAAKIPGTTSAPATRSATIKSGVTLRAGADNKAASLGTLKTGQQVDLVGCKIWCEVVADGKRGFVFKNFVVEAPKAGG